MIELSDSQYQEFCDFLQKICGISLGENKHYLVNSRLNKVLRDNNITSITELLNIVRQSQQNQLRDRVVDAMTTNETFWFRDNYPFEALKKIILPELLKKPCSLRIWSSACSSGQEPYSISMTLDEYAANRFVIPPIQIVATDISPTSLEKAKLATYDEKTLKRGMSDEQRHKFFDRHGNHWQVKEGIRNRVQFRLMNLLTSYAPLGRFDIIFCRNVLIYFSTDIKRDILRRMIAMVNTGGYIFLGSSETMSGLTDMVEMVKTPLGVFYRVR